MSNYLSQDEIDSLLSGLSGDGGGAEGGGSGGDERYKILTPVFELFCKTAGSVLGTAVTKTVDLTPEACVKADFAAMSEKLPADVLSLSLSLVSGVEGDMYLIIGKKEIAVLADLMMMGDGSADYNEEADDAASELFNQVMGAFTTAFGAEIGESVSAGNAAVSPFDLANPPFDADSADMGIAKLTVNGLIDSSVVLIIPNTFGDEIIDMKTPKPSSSAMDMGIGISQSEMDELTNMAASSFSSGGGSSFGSTPSYAPAPSYAPPPPPRSGSTYDGPKENIELLLDVELDINIELGKSELSIKKILELAPGSIVELDKMAGEPVDLIVNNKIVARGEVVVVDENFGIRIVSLVSAEDRIKSLK
ncbi:MAG: flagellar motor switch protein FliN [Chitinispirillales bacterium]|nr:flagellar motor switch protein FliN [Chitinispirillales bacterium]